MSMTTRIEDHHPKIGPTHAQTVMKEEGRTAMRAAVNRAKDEMVALAPKGHTGKLARRISATVRASQGGVSGGVVPREHYAPMVNRGTGIYVEHHAPIRPLPARRRKPNAALRFKDEGGEIIFRRKAKGQKPTRFVQRAERMAEQPVLGLLDAGAKRVAERLGG